MPNTTAVRTAQVGAAPFFAGKNKIINGDLGVWQRGTSFTGTGAVQNTADRWQGFNAATTTISRQLTSDTTNLPGIQYCSRVQRNTSSTSGFFVFFAQSFETVNSIPYAGKVVTLSFYARRGANFSSASNLLLAEVITGTGTDQNVLSGFTGSAASVTGSASLTTTWQRFSYTGTIPATATQIGINFSYIPTGTAGAADFYEITGVQLEAGSTATAFQTATGTIQGELAACQRYFEMITGGGGVIGQAANTTAINIVAMYKVTKRVAPTLTGLLSVVAAFIPNGGSYTNSSGSTYTFGAGMAQGVNGVWAQISGFSGITTDKFAYINTTSNIISVDAEL
jgi:hypothetical protein